MFQFNQITGSENQSYVLLMKYSSPFHRDVWSFILLHCLPWLTDYTIMSGLALT